MERYLSTNSKTTTKACKLPADCSDIFISFGGLLMSISGDVKSLRSLEIDSRVYLLLSKL